MTPHPAQDALASLERLHNDFYMGIKRPLQLVDEDVAKIKEVIQSASREWQDIDDVAKEIVWKPDESHYGRWLIATDGRNVRECRWWQWHDGSASNFLDRGGNDFQAIKYQPLPTPPSLTHG